MHRTPRGLEDWATHQANGTVVHVPINSTRPHTLAFGLNDSPAGLAAWLVDKYGYRGRGRNGCTTSGGGRRCHPVGHFQALEEPALLVDELRAFFRPLRVQD